MYIILPLFTQPHLKAEASTALVVGQVAHWSSSIPEGLAAVGISLVLLEQLEELHKSDPVTNIGTTQLLQMRLLNVKHVCVFIVMGNQSNES